MEARQVLANSVVLADGVSPAETLGHCVERDRRMWTCLGASRGPAREEDDRGILRMLWRMEGLRFFGSLVYLSQRCPAVSVRVFNDTTKRDLPSGRLSSLIDLDD